MRENAAKIGGLLPREAGEAQIVPFGRMRRLDRAGARLTGLVARERGVPSLLLLHSSRCTSEVAEARQLAMYLMHIVLQRTYSEIGSFFGRDRTTVSHACARIEDRRDDPAFEAEVARLESALCAAGPSREARHGAG